MFKIITIDELLKILDQYEFKELHIHHTWEPNHADFTGNNGMQLQEAMRNYHVKRLGWNNIGQHVTLLPTGEFVTGRPFSQRPASIAGYNTGAFACEMLGNFDIGHDILEGKQRESIIKLSQYFDKKKKYIRFHRENASKSCPGTSIDKDEFMKEVKGEVKVVKPILKLGDKGEEVKELQRLLYKKGQHIKIDGDFGKITQLAVKQFQKQYEIPIDGIVGPKTWRCLYE